MATTGRGSAPGVTAAQVAVTPPSTGRVTPVT
jgi:hypothetical protein